MEIVAGGDQRTQPGSTALLDFVSLLKPRVMSLVVFTAFVGIMIAPGSHDPVVGAAALLCIALGAGASGALNMWYDADIDAVMSRTARRPIPAGRVKPCEALRLGLILACASVLMLGLLTNWAAAGMLALTIFYYIVIYTMWLKRTTPLNIVIGGAAGALPPMIGWMSVANGSISIEPVLLSLIIFFWTPPHFWALSLYRTADYARAGVPMLPVVSGTEKTIRQVLLYTVILVPIGVAPSVAGFASAVYGSASFLAGMAMLLFAWRLHAKRTERAAKHLFSFSIIYLFLLFATLLVEHGQYPIRRLLL